MVDLPKGLRRLVRIVRTMTALGAFAEVGSSLWFWSNRAAIQDAALEISGVGPEVLFLDGRAQLLGALVALPLSAVTLFGLWHLWRLFGEYTEGRYFSPGTQRHLRLGAWALLLGAILVPLRRMGLSVAFTLGNPPGQRWLNVGVSTDLFFPILLSTVLLAIAIVLSEASRIAEENGQFV